MEFDASKGRNEPGEQPRVEVIVSTLLAYEAALRSPRTPDPSFGTETGVISSRTPGG